MLDKQLEEYNKQKEEEQQKEEELNKASLISVSNLGDIVDIDLKDEKYNNVYGTTDTSGTYSFKLVYKSTNTITSGTIIGLLCTQYLGSANYNNAKNNYSWSANLKDSNNNLYQLTDIKIPTEEQINKAPNDNLRSINKEYWTSTEIVGNNSAYVVYDSGYISGGGNRSYSYAVVPYIELTLK